MLTPIGEGGAAYRRRRRWPRVLAVLLVLALVAAAAGGAWWWFTQRGDTDPQPAASPSRTCTTPTPKPPRRLPDPEQVTVDVANGTDVAGLALDTADELAARGFVVGDIGNTDKPVKEGVAVVRYAEPQLAAAVVVASYVPGAELVPATKVQGDVALWLGPEFDGLVSRDDADVDAVALPPGEPECRRQR